MRYTAFVISHLIFCESVYDVTYLHGNCTFTYTVYVCFLVQLSIVYEQYR